MRCGGAVVLGIQGLRHADFVTIGASSKLVQLAFQQIPFSINKAILGKKLPIPIGLELSLYYKTGGDSEVLNRGHA